MTADPSAIAATIVQARRAATGLPDFPGAPPQDLSEAYAIQTAARALWGDRVAGWKVGRITGAAEQRLGKNRFIGPIFATSVSSVEAGGHASFPIIPGGSAALESEVVAVLAQDVEPRRADWGREDVADLLSALHIGIEVAGCPVARINMLGPLASIAAFGNNLALILGPAIADWRGVAVDDIACRTSINDELTGEAVAGQLPGGPFEAVAFALNQAAELGIPLPAGSLLSTGAITGVHPIDLGQEASADFGRWGRIDCRTVPLMGSHG